MVLILFLLFLVTGASFVVFNGALKTSSGFLAKSSIVEGKNFVLWGFLLRELKKKKMSSGLVQDLIPQ